MPLPWWDERTLNAIRRIESGGRDDTVTGSNRGPFQMGPREWSRYGGGGNVFDPSDATAAARRKFADDASAYKRDFGDDPTGDKLYLYHQQGRAGGREHLRNPEGVAWQNVRKFYPSDAVAKKAIWGNVPTDVRSQYQGGVEGLTSGQFADMWRNKFARFAGAPDGQQRELPQAPMGVGAPAIMASAQGRPADWEGERMNMGPSPAPGGSAGGGIMNILQSVFGGPAAAAQPLAPTPSPEQFGPPAPPMDVGQPDMAPGPGGIAPPPEQPSPFPPLHDPSAFGGGQLPEVPGIATTPQAPRLPGITSSIPPATDTGTAPPPPGLGPNQLPPGWGPQGAPPGVERRGPVGGGGMAPAMGGGGLYDYIAGGGQGGFGGLLQSLNAGLGSRGVSMALPLAFGQAGAQSAAAGQGAHELAIREAMAGREQTKFGQEQEAYQARRRAWEGVQRGGRDHPLMKGVPEPYAELALSMDQEKGLEALQQYQLSSAKQKMELEKAAELQRQKLSTAREFVTGQAGAAAAPQGAAAAPAPAPTGSFGGAGIGGAMSGVDYTPPPALAPQITSPGAPAAPRGPTQASGTRGLPEPMVDAGGGRKLTLGQAITEARVLNIGGMRDELLESNIRAAQKETEVPPALKEQAIKVDQAYTDMSSSLDRYNKIIQKYPKGMGFLGKSADRDIARGERNNIILQAKELYGLGQLSRADLDLAMSIPDPELRLMPAPFSGDDAGLNFPGVGLADRTQQTIDAMKERIRSTRNIKGEIVGMPPIPPPPAKGEEKKADAKSEPQTGPPASLKGMEKKEADEAYAKIPKGHTYYDPMGRLKRKVD